MKKIFIITVVSCFAAVGFTAAQDVPVFGREPIKTDSRPEAREMQKQLIEKSVIQSEQTQKKDESGKQKEEQKK